MSSPRNADPRPKFAILTTDDPYTLLSLLCSNRTAPFLILRRPASPASTPSGYFIEYVHNKRGLLECVRAMSGVDITRNEWYCHQGLYWPDDLSRLPGPWKTPLTFSFPRLTLLDLDVEDAVYWLVPILQAVVQHAPLRRVILRGCVDYDAYAIPFPFRKFDRCLDHWPAAKVLIGWADSEEDKFIGIWRGHLPKLESAGRIGVLYSGGPHSVLPPIDSDEEDLGPELVDDETGVPYRDVYAPGCVNEWSWQYHPDQDPFGSIYE